MATRRDFALMALGAAIFGVGWQSARVFGDSAARSSERDELVRRAEEPFAQTFRRVAAFARPSVVYVEARHDPSLTPSSDFAPRSTDETLPDETLRRFFMSPLRFESEGGEVRVATSGSGVIVDAAGVVFTNAHVIASRAGSRRFEIPDVRVKLEDGRWFHALVVGCEPRADLAILRIVDRPEDLTPAIVGDSDRLERGDWVMALGDPFGREATASLGIVSTKGRSSLDARFEDFLQTDAAINPGNSGGPLVDVRGSLVGINLGVAWTSGGSTGVGFAIPSNTAGMLRRHVEEIADVASRSLGASVRELLPEELGGRRGLVVSAVGSCSGASLRAGDVLLGVSGQDLAERARAEKRLSLAVWREGRESRIELELGRAVARTR